LADVCAGVLILGPSGAGGYDDGVIVGEQPVCLVQGDELGEKEARLLSD